MKQDSTTRQVHTAVNDGWMQGGSFLGSILSGTLLGYLADSWLGTEPWLVVIGAVVGSYSGFLNVWRYAKETGRPDGER
jgi:F0F1-type ATP synthase assembly protein I